MCDEPPHFLDHVHPREAGLGSVTAVQALRFYYDSDQQLLLQNDKNFQLDTQSSVDEISSEYRFHSPNYRVWPLVG